MSNHQTSNIYPLTVPAVDDEYQPTTKDLLLFVVSVRRNIRRAIAILDAQRATPHYYLRQARILRERASPFDGARIAALETAAAEVTAACEPMRESLKKSGKLLTDAAPMIDAGTTLAQRCEILNVNPADRGDLTEADGLSRIVFAHALEDSAARRGLDWDDGPMWQASQHVFMDFLLHTKEGQDLGDSLFQPGGMFANLPMYTQAANGARKRLPPQLHVVPDARTDAASL